MPSQTPVPGSQSVSRAIHLLKLVGMHHEVGIALSSLVDITELDRTTAYRLLSCLVQSRLIERDDKKRYRLGLEAMQLGLKSMNRVPILERCRPLMIRLARRTEDTVFLLVRNGDYAHCIHSEEGSFPIKALVLQVDGLRLLGIGSAGTALLSTLNDAEISDFHRRQQAKLPEPRANLPRLLKEVRLIRSRGYAFTDNLVSDGVGGVGVSFEVTPNSYASIGIGAIKTRMGLERKKWIAQIMHEELGATGWKSNMKQVGA